MSDSELVDKIRDSDTELYREIVERYQAKLIRYAYTIMHDEDSAKDVVQNSFIKAYVNLKSFDTSRKFSSWIYRIVHNEALNAIKKKSKEFRPDDETWFDHIPADAAPFEETVDKKLLKNAVLAQIDKLSMKYREPVLLYYYEGQSYQQISEVLRIPVATVGTRINRGKKTLHEILKEQGIDHEW